MRNTIAKNWITTTYCGMMSKTEGNEATSPKKSLKPNLVPVYNGMFEKYDGSRIGRPGGGGEYDVQQGFGWTNGITLWVLNEFGDRLKEPRQCF